MLTRTIFAEQVLCSCYNHGNFWKIQSLIHQYEETARKNFLDSLPPYREKWESKFHAKVREINSKFRPNPRRYPDVYQNILLFSQKIDIVKDYKFQWAYELYMSPGWAYNLAEKERRIAKEREKFAKHAQECHQKIEECTTKILNEYVKLYEECLTKHTCLATYHDYGLLACLNNNFDKSLELLSKMIEQADKTGEIETLDAAVYHNLGSVCIEAMVYDKAIKFLSEAIKRDPSNKEAHFDRAVAYFETGSFDSALEDYLLADKGKGMPKSTFEASNEFISALLSSVCQGAAEAAVEFVPSLCSSAYGLGEALWAVNPLNPKSVENTNQFASACYEMAECVVDYYKNIDWETVDGYVEQVKTLYEHFDQLNDSEKGELIGYTVGKYGVDLFAGGAVVKSVSTYRKLRTANRICNLESMAISNANKEAIITSSLKHASEREAFFKNIRIEIDKQNKHIVGEHNFELGRSEFVHSDPQHLLSKFAGKGKPINNKMPGTPDYRERVDFGELIGYYVSEENPGIKFPTTKGTIRYSKKGAHIIPSHPDGK